MIREKNTASTDYGRVPKDTCTKLYRSNIGSYVGNILVNVQPIVSKCHYVSFGNSFQVPLPIERELLNK